MVFVDDGEGGRGHGLGDSELTADGSDEGGLAGAHLAIEGEDARGGSLRAPGGGGLRGRGEQGGGGDEVAGYCGEGLEVVDLMFHCFLGEGGGKRGKREREEEGGGRGEDARIRATLNRSYFQLSDFYLQALILNYELSIMNY